MKTLAAVLVACSVLLFLSLFAGGRSIRRPWRFLAIAAGTAVACNLLLAVLIGYWHLERDSLFLRVLKGTAQITEEPVLVLIGSSYTARNLDGARLQSALRRAGSKLRVVQLSSPGGFAFEQDFYLEKMLSGGSRPALVLAELGTEQSVAVALNNRMKQGTIAYHDFARVSAMARICGASDCTYGDFFASVLPHAAARWFHVGFAHGAISPIAVQSRPGYQPEPKLRDAMPLEQIRQGLLSQDVQSAPPTAVEDYLHERARHWTSLGAKKVLFWQPPSADPGRRGYTKSLCLALAADCLLFDEPESLDGDYWNDRGHLTQSGAERFTDWLAQRLIAKLGI